MEVNAEGTELYVGDVNCLRKLNLNTMQVTTAAGNGKPMGLVIYMPSMHRTPDY
jgi:hypothetical protein